MKYSAFTFLLTMLLVISYFAESKPTKVLEYPSPLVREEQHVMVDGQVETWQLKWEFAPAPHCEPDESSLPCPCAGFAYGEKGKLAVIRMESGREIDRLDVVTLFDEADTNEKDVAIIQRWPVEYDKDFEASQLPDFSSLVMKRNITQVMHFADYNHDGWKTEFYLQTYSGPCGHRGGVVIGVSKMNRHLHVFGTASKPASPLRLQGNEWDALLRHSQPFEITHWACSDHAADTETTFSLRWSNAGIDGLRREFTCPENGEKGKLIRETRLPNDNRLP